MGFTFTPCEQFFPTLRVMLIAAPIDTILEVHLSIYIMKNVA
jgi:hypothetical protein